MTEKTYTYEEREKFAALAYKYEQMANETNWLDTESRQKYLELSNKYYEMSLPY